LITGTVVFGVLVGGVVVWKRWKWLRAYLKR